MLPVPVAFATFLSSSSLSSSALGVAALIAFFSLKNTDAATIKVRGQPTVSGPLTGQVTITLDKKAGSDLAVIKDEVQAKGGVRAKGGNECSPESLINPCDPLVKLTPARQSGVVQLTPARQSGVVQLTPAQPQVDELTAVQSSSLSSSSSYQANATNSSSLASSRAGTSSWLQNVSSWSAIPWISNISFTSVRQNLDLLNSNITSGSSLSSSQSNATFINETNSPWITSLIAENFGLAPNTSSQFLNHSASLLSSMMVGNESSFPAAMDNFTNFLSSSNLTPKQTSALIFLTASQANLTGQVNSSSFRKFSETISPFMVSNGTMVPAFQSSLSPADATYIGNLENISTAIISNATGVDNDKAKQFIEVSNALVTSNFSESAKNNFTKYLETVSPWQASMLVSVTSKMNEIYQGNKTLIDHAGGNETKQNATFFETTARLFQDVYAGGNETAKNTSNTQSNSEGASANSVDSKQDSPELRFLAIIALMFPICAFITYKTRQQDGIVVPAPAPDPEQPAAAQEQPAAAPVQPAAAQVHAHLVAIPGNAHNLGIG